MDSRADALEEAAEKLIANCSPFNRVEPGIHRQDFVAVREEHYLRLKAAILLHAEGPRGPEEEQWQPIETARRDSSKILVSNGVDVWAAEWCELANWFVESGTDAPGLSADMLEDVTHWRHMPIPPTSSPPAGGS